MQDRIKMQLFAMVVKAAEGLVAAEVVTEDVAAVVVLVMVSQGKAETEKIVNHLNKMNPKSVDGRPENWCGVCGYWTWGETYSHTSDVCPYCQQQAANIAGQVTPTSVAASGAAEFNPRSGGNDNLAGQQEGQRVHFAGIPALHFT